MHLISLAYTLVITLPQIVASQTERQGGRRCCPAQIAERAGRRFGASAHKTQQDAELACRLQAQEQIAIARERQRARCLLLGAT
jgi:hypothetical protein